MQNTLISFSPGFINKPPPFIEIIDNKSNASSELLASLKSTNLHYWEGYFLIGKYYYNKGYYKAALKEFELALTKEVTTVPDKEQLKKYIKKIKRKN